MFNFLKKKKETGLHIGKGYALDDYTKQNFLDIFQNTLFPIFTDCPSLCHYCLRDYLTHLYPFFQSAYFESVSSQ